MALSLLVLDYVLVAPNFYGTFFFGKVTILLYWFLQMFFLGGPRIAYRLFRHVRTQQQAKGPEAAPALVLGRAADAGVGDHAAILVPWLLRLLNTRYDPNTEVGLHQKEEIWFDSPVRLGERVILTGSFTDKYVKRDKGYIVTNAHVVSNVNTTTPMSRGNQPPSGILSEFDARNR